MHFGELLIVILVGLSLPLVAGVGVLAWARPRLRLTRGRLIEAVVLGMLSFSISLLLVMFGPSSWGRYIGIRDVTLFGANTSWAPFTFISVAVALPVVIWWSRKRGRA